MIQCKKNENLTKVIKIENATIPNTHNFKLQYIKMKSN